MDIDAGRYRLRIGGWYELRGLQIARTTGIPTTRSGGKRSWHIFEVWIAGREQGVIVMNQADLAEVILSPANPAEGFTED